jgi:hypothetical protein
MRKISRRVALAGPLLLAGASQPTANLAASGPPPSNGGGLVRNRPRITNRTILSDKGTLLRAVHMHTNVPPDNFAARWYTDVNWWHNIYNVGHFNAVRAAAYIGPWFGSGPVMDIPTLQSQLDIFVANASQSGTYVIICNFSGGTPNNDPIDWSVASKLWDGIASRYANNTNVIYELQNEPDFGIDSASLAANEQALYQQVRAAAPNTPILCWSFSNIDNGDPSVLAMAPGIDYSNAVVAWHAYVGRGNRRYAAYRSTLISAGYPNMMGETDGESFAAGFDLCANAPASMEHLGTSWAWLNGDGFTDAATGIIYGNQGGSGGPISITWPSDG